MAFNDDIVLSKGVYSVTIFTTKPTENFKNELKVIAPVKAPGSQSETLGPATVVDLLRITHTFVIGGYITATETKTAKRVKDDLVAIMRGGGQNGAGAVDLTYDGDNLKVFIKDLVIIKTPNDNASAGYSGKDSGEYQITLTLTEGEGI